MARPLRIEYDGAVYHITSRGNASTKKTKTEGYFLRYFIEQIPDTTGYVMPIAL